MFVASFSTKGKEVGGEVYFSQAFIILSSSGVKENAGKALRIFVEGGGCSGMQYGMVFDDRRDDDFSVEFNGIAVLVDPFSAKYLHGAVVDFSDSLTAGGFKISNPNAAQSCGCGKSFAAQAS